MDRKSKKNRKEEGTELHFLKLERMQRTALQSAPWEEDRIAWEEKAWLDSLAFGRALSSFLGS